MFSLDSAALAQSDVLTLFKLFADADVHQYFAFVPEPAEYALKKVLPWHV
jgi:hypothetical protein